MGPARVAAVVFFAVVAIGCARVAISWEPAALRVAMEPNAYRVHEVTLRARSTIDSLDLIVPASMRSIVSVVPPTVQRVAAGSRRAIRFEFHLPATTQPGQPIKDILVPGLPVTLDIIPASAEGTLESMHLALAFGNDAAYLDQFAPRLIPEQRKTLATFTDTARQALARTLRTAERIALSGDTAEYRVTLLLRGQRVESSIVLQRSSDGVWRVVRF